MSANFRHITAGLTVNDMKYNEIYLGYDHTKIEERYLVEECDYDECGNAVNPIMIPHNRTIAKVTNGISARAMIDIEKVYEQCTIDELIAIAAYAKQLANEKIRNMKKYL